MAFVGLLTILWTRRRLYWISWQIPGPPSLPIVGNLTIILKCGVDHVIPEALRLIKQYGGDNQVCRIWIGPELTLLIGDAEVARQVYSMTLNRADVYEHMFRPYLTKGSFQDSNIQHWKACRKLIDQVFHYKEIRKYIPVFHKESLILAEKFRRYAETGDCVYAADVVESSTLGSIQQTMLGTNMDDPKSFIESYHVLLQHFQSKIFYSFLRVPIISSLLGYRKDEYENGMTVLKEGQSLVNRQKDDSVALDRPTLTSVLSRMPHMTDHEMVDHTVNILITGSETSGVQISFLLVLLAIHPEVQNKVYEEAIQILGEDCNICPSYEDLSKLEYMDRVLKECLRMFPAGAMGARKTTQDIMLTFADGSKYTIPPGVTLAILTQHIQNSPYYYENPETFDPDRWLAENLGKRNSHAFIPFGSGPRNCIGGKYALFQMKSFTATLLREFEILPTQTCKTLDDIRIRINFSTSLNRSCKIRFKKRVGK